MDEPVNVERERDPADKRHYKIWVTPVGLTWIAQTEKLIAKTEDELFGPLSARQRKTLLDLMHGLFRESTAD